MQTEFQFADINIRPQIDYETHADKEILSVVLKSGKRGIIAAEIVEELPHLPYGTATSRFQPLLRMGKIEVIGRRKGPSGRMQKIWRHVSYGNY